MVSEEKDSGLSGSKRCGRVGLRVNPVLPRGGERCTDLGQHRISPNRLNHGVLNGATTRYVGIGIEIFQACFNYYSELVASRSIRDHWDNQEHNENKRGYQGFSFQYYRPT